MGVATGAYVYQPGQAELRWLGETSAYFLATGEKTEETFCLVDERGLRGESVPLHRHPSDMESFYVLEGELSLYIGDQAGVSAPAGSFAHLPGGTVHGFRIESEKRPLPDLHDTAPRRVLPRDHPRVPTRRPAASRINRRSPDQAGQQGLRRRVHRAAARSSGLGARASLCWAEGEGRDYPPRLPLTAERHAARAPKIVGE